MAKTQQLHASNISVRIGEAIQARTKDPLWFLARQWQTGEFAAENGGKPAYISVDWQDYPLDTLTIGSTSDPIDLDQPLEYAVEREDVAGDSAAWRTEALEYEFKVDTSGHRLAAEEYDGHRLDWYHFDFTGPRPAAAPAMNTRRVTPTQLYVRGAPNPRWWRIEESDSYFDTPVDPEPNVLSLLLPEFFYVDANNWFIAPVPGLSGVMRVIDKLTVVDSFGVTTEVGPVGADGWRVFALATAEDSSVKPLDASHLFLPNIALDVLHNDDIEDVRFMRDEEANLVWAVEHRYRLADGTEVVNGDNPDGAWHQLPVVAGSGIAAPPAASLPRFVLRSDVAPHWIPYVPRHVSTSTVTNGEIYLRRARTVEAASQANPQHHSRIVGESWRINEEQVPRTGIRVRRIARFARGSDGIGYHWTGRYRETGRRSAHPELHFDYIEEG